VYCNSHTSHPKVTPIHIQTRQSPCCHDESFQKQWNADPSVDAADIQRPSKQKDAAANQFGQSPSQARSLRQWSPILGLQFFAIASAISACNSSTCPAQQPTISKMFHRATSICISNQSIVQHQHKFQQLYCYILTMNSEN
jgi:hypothetical protein